MVYDDLVSFYNKYNGRKTVLGKSTLGKNIYGFYCGSGKRKCIVQGCIHAREYVNCYFILKMIKRYRDFRGGEILFIPLVNPDGVEICQNGKPLYKANANKVDLNTNFDAKWGSGKYNVKVKGDENYIGRYPFSEKETVLLKEVTLKYKPNFTISYHTKGEEIYFDFFQDKERYYRDKRLAEVIAKTTGYKIVEGLPSAGGYKDWCVEKLKIPSFTIETGNDGLPHPIDKKYAKNIFAKNKNVLKRLFDSYD